MLINSSFIVVILRKYKDEQLNFNLLDVLNDEVFPKLREMTMERWDHEQWENWQDKYRKNELLKGRYVLLWFYRMGCFSEILILVFYIYTY